MTNRSNAARAPSVPDEGGTRSARALAKLGQQILLPIERFSCKMTFESSTGGLYVKLGLMLAAGLLTVSAFSAAVPANASSGTSDTVILAVFGDSQHAIDEEFSMVELSPLGVDLNEYQPTFNGAVVDTTTSAFNPEVSFDLPSSSVIPSSEESVAQDSQPDLAVAAAPSGSYGTVSTWTDRAGRFTRLRLGYWNGSAGFGYTKVKNYHNLTTASMKATTRYYSSYYTEGSTRVYIAPVNKVSCTGTWPFRTCRVVGATNVRLIHETRVLNDGGYFGVVTSYCSGYTRCPDWVKNAVNI